MTATTLINFIKEVIINYEPRVSLTNVDVSVSIDNNGFDVTISYIILNRSQPVTIKLFLERIR